MKKTTTKIIALLWAAGLIVGGMTGCTAQSPEETTAATTPAAETTTTAETTVSADTTASEETAETTEAAPSEEGEIGTLYQPNFKIEKLSDGIKRVTDGDGRELILVPKSLGEIPAEYADSTVITTPVRNAVFLSSTQVCTFRTASDSAILDGIGGVSGSAGSWSDIPGIAERMEHGQIVDVTGDSGFGEPDYEKIQALEPDVVFVYTGEYGQQTAIAKLEELGISYAVDNEYLEDSYLARMEWMRFLLTFFNADDTADRIMTSARANVDAAKEKTAGLEKPAIAIFNVYDGTVYITRENGWTGTMIGDMGGANAFAGIADSTLTLEAAYDAVLDADVIIYSSSPMYCSGLPAILDQFPQLAECKAYENNRIYQHDDSYWNGIDQTDIMACDLAAILYPEAFPDRALTYYIKLEK